MQNTNLIGQTVRFSSRDQKTGIVIRRLTIIKEAYSDNADDYRRYYLVKDVATGEEFYALADKYDEYFMTKQSLIKPKNHRDAIQNKSQLGL